VNDGPANVAGPTSLKATENWADSFNGDFLGSGICLQSFLIYLLQPVDGLLCLYCRIIVNKRWITSEVRVSTTFQKNQNRTPLDPEQIR
jgi:hypothetical protein